MPTYEYECKSCNHRLEAFQSMTDAPLSRCPQCGRKSLRRLISPGAGIIFKGSGFYVTDYARSSSSRASAKPSESNDSKTKSGDSSE